MIRLFLDSKQNGITLRYLKQEFDSKRTTLQTRMLKFKELLQILINNFFILSVGVVDRVYVAHQFKQHWVIQSVKNNKGRSTSSGTFRYSDEVEEANQISDEKYFNENGILMKGNC